jgi:hypothetical protein
MFRVENIRLGANGFITVGDWFFGWPVSLKGGEV